MPGWNLMSFTTENKIVIIHSKCNWYGCVHLNLQMPWDNNSERCEYPQLQDLLLWRFIKRTSTCTWEHTDIWTNNFQLVGLSPGSPCCSWTSWVSMSWRMLEGTVAGKNQTDAWGMNHCRNLYSVESLMPWIALVITLVSTSPFCASISYADIQF